jgi:hypothetical protein
MERVILLLIITIEFIYATEYRLIHLKKGGRLNVRDTPIINSATVVGTIPASAVGIKIRECKYARDGKEWCYISYPMGANHLDGWVSKYFLAPMGDDTSSYIYIKTFLKNYYMADEENFLDKLKIFYRFPMQQYFNKKNVNLIQLRTAKVLFYKRWIIRKYKLLGLKILKRGNGYIDVQTVVRWRFQNRDDSQSGKDIHKVRLVRENNQFKVLAIKNLKQIIDPKLNEDSLDNNMTLDNNKTIGKQFYIKVGSFLSNPNGEYLFRISQNGFSYHIQDVMQNGDMIKRVYIGPYSTEREAIEMLKEIRVKINKNAYIQSF